MVTAAPAYPVTFDVEYPERLSRWNTLFRWLLILPLVFFNVLGGVLVHPAYFALILLPFYPLLYVMAGTAIPVWFALLSNARYPRLLFPIAVWAQRLILQIQAYELLVTDQFPFDERDRPVRFEVDYPASQSPVTVFFRLILVIPHVAILFFLGIVLLATTVIAWFGILFTGNYPEGLWRFAVGTLRWSARVGAYVSLLTGEYPPFSLS